MKKPLGFLLLLPLFLFSPARAEAQPADTRLLSTAVDEAKIELSLNNFFSVKADRGPTDEGSLGAFEPDEQVCGDIATLPFPSSASGGRLSVLDCRLTEGSHVSFHAFQGGAGETVTIDLNSFAFDPVLFLLNPEGRVVATNDDFAGATDSRIVFTLNASGTWVIAANSFGPDQFGAYRLALTGASSPEFSACTPNATTLCLAAARFQVTVDWRAVTQGTSGVGMAVPLTADTGYFWFFSSNNIELVIKVLDARIINNFFWVFYGALSDVEYTIRVTDTVTGIIKTYTNPQGRLASVADTAAFAGGPIAGVSKLYLSPILQFKLRPNPTPETGGSTYICLSRAEWLATLAEDMVGTSYTFNLGVGTDFLSSGTGTLQAEIIHKRGSTETVLASTTFTTTTTYGVRTATLTGPDPNAQAGDTLLLRVRIVSPSPGLPCVVTFAGPGTTHFIEVPRTTVQAN